MLAGPVCEGAWRVSRDRSDLVGELGVLSHRAGEQPRQCVDDGGGIACGIWSRAKSGVRSTRSTGSPRALPVVSTGWCWARLAGPVSTGARPDQTVPSQRRHNDVGMYWISEAGVGATTIPERPGLANTRPYRQGFTNVWI